MKHYSILLFTIVVVAFFHTTVTAQKRKANKETTEWHYEAECVEIGQEGTKMIKVWSYSTKHDIAALQAKKNAVHAVIFKGFAGNKKAGCPAQSPMTRNSDLEEEQAAYFKDFFSDHGKYMKYVNLATGEGSESKDVIKIKRKGKKDLYKVGVIVVVMYSRLRKDLEKDNIIQSLNRFQ